MTNQRECSRGFSKGMGSSGMGTGEYPHALMLGRCENMSRLHKRELQEKWHREGQA